VFLIALIAKLLQPATTLFDPETMRTSFVWIKNTYRVPQWNDPWPDRKPFDSDWPEFDEYLAAQHTNKRVCVAASSASMMQLLSWRLFQLRIPTGWCDG